MWKDTPEGWEDLRDVVVYPAVALGSLAAITLLTVKAVTYRDATPTVIPRSPTPDCSVESPVSSTTPSAPLSPEHGLEVTSIPISIEPANSEHAVLIAIPPQAADISLHMPQC